MVESSALLKRRTSKGYRGFESLPHRFFFIRCSTPARERLRSWPLGACRAGALRRRVGRLPFVNSVPTEPDKIRNFIDGQFVEPVGGRYLDNIEPATGKPYSQVTDSDARDVDLAP